MMYENIIAKRDSDLSNYCKMMDIGNFDSATDELESISAKLGVRNSRSLENEKMYLGYIASKAAMTYIEESRFRNHREGNIIGIVYKGDCRGGAIELIYKDKSILYDVHPRPLG